uniref:Uncharacterized protein LOC104247758 n=1 Tax=Nicotiana sylvestris TaxID=4096 RepID=A0A1U7YTL8_NICSY|nr:PREDICTED: uncharacterized protein LOC104247758 [Nicotiana sylvestris]
MPQVSVSDSGHSEVLWSSSNQKVKQFLGGPKQLIKMKHGSGRSRHSIMTPQTNHHIFKLTRFYLSETRARKFVNPQDPPWGKHGSRARKFYFFCKDPPEESMAQAPTWRTRVNISRLVPSQ